MPTKINPLHHCETGSARREGECRVWSNTTASDSTFLTIIEIRGLCNLRTGLINKSAIDIIEMFSNARQDYYTDFSGVTIRVDGYIPSWCRQRFKTFSDGVSVQLSTRAVVTSEDVEDSSEEISDLCVYLFGREHKVFTTGAEEILASSKKGETELPSYSHQNYLQKKIERTYFDLLAVKWENSKDLIIMLSILEYFYEKNDEGRCKSTIRRGSVGS